MIIYSLKKKKPECAQKSHKPQHRTVIWKEPGSDPLADLGGPPGEAGGNWNTPWEKRHWWQSFWGARSSTITLVWQVPFCNPPARRLAPGTWPHPQQQKLPRTLSQTDSLKSRLPQAPESPYPLQEAWPCSQSGWGSAPPTRVPAVVNPTTAGGCAQLTGSYKSSLVVQMVTNLPAI